MLDWNSVAVRSHCVVNRNLSDILVSAGLSSPLSSRIFARASDSHKERWLLVAAKESLC